MVPRVSMMSEGMPDEVVGRDRRRVGETDGVQRDATQPRPRPSLVTAGVWPSEVRVLPLRTSAHG